MTALARFADALVRALATSLLLSMLACVTLGVVFRTVGNRRAIDKGNLLIQDDGVTSDLHFVSNGIGQQ